MSCYMNHIAVGNSKLGILSLETFENVKEFELSNTSTYAINNYSPFDHSRVIKGGSNGDITVFNLETEKIDLQFKPNKSWIWDTCQVPGRPIHCSIGDGQHIKFWEDKDGTEIQSHKTNERMFSLLVLDPKTLLVIGNTKASFLDLETFKMLPKRGKICGGYYGIFMKERELIGVASSEDGVVRFYDSREFKPSIEFDVGRGGHMAIYTLCEIFPYGQICFGGLGGYLGIWDLRKTDKELKKAKNLVQVEKVVDAGDERRIIVGDCKGLCEYDYMSNPKTLKLKRSCKFPNTVYAMTLIQKKSSRLDEFIRLDFQERKEYLFSEEYRDHIFGKNKRFCVLKLKNCSFEVLKISLLL